MIDWGRGLVQLGLTAEDFGPVVNEDYAQLKKYWRGRVSLPSEADLLAAIEAGKVADTAAKPQPLPDNAGIPALLARLRALGLVV